MSIPSMRQIISKTAEEVLLDINSDSENGLSYSEVTSRRSVYGMNKLVSEEKEHIVFLLWGGFAQKKGSKIDRSKHLVLESGHPSPLSANRGFWFGNQHFKDTNLYLKRNGISVSRCAARTGNEAG